MKSLAKLSVVIWMLTLCILLFVSCKKEESCEGCREGNKPPIAIAGPDQVITLPTDSVSLNGNASSDPDGKISVWLWTKISGPAFFSIIKPSDSISKVKALIAGTYQFELKVTDAGGLSARDTVLVNVLTTSTVFPLNCSSRPVIKATLNPIGFLSSARANMIIATAGTKILFIGGWHAGQNWWNEPVPVDIYDISSNLWSVHFLVPNNSQMSHFRFGAASASVGSKIFIAGGGDGYGDNQTAQVDIYDASSDTWSMSQLSGERQGISAATLGNKILFAGGFGYPDGSNWGEFNTVDIYDNSNNSWSTASLSQARTDITATTSGNSIYFAGGRNGINVSNVIDIYDATNNSWSVSSLQQSRIWMASIATNNKIFWASGVKQFNGSGRDHHDNAEILDLNSGVTSYVCMLTRSGFSAVKKNENIVFFTGREGGNGNQFEIYNTNSGTWSTGMLNQKIQGAAIISVNNTIYVAGGLENGAYSNRVWKLEF